MVIDPRTSNCYASALRLVPHQAIAMPVPRLKSGGLGCVATSQGFCLLLRLWARLLLDHVLLDEDFLIVSNNLNVHLCVFCMDNDLSSYQFTSITVWSPFLKILSNIINAIPVKRTPLSWASSMSTCLWDSWKKTSIFRLSRAFGATQSSGFFRYHCNNELVASTVTIFSLLTPVVLTAWINIAP